MSESNNWYRWNQGSHTLELVKDIYISLFEGFLTFTRSFPAKCIAAWRKIVEVILLDFRSNLGNKDKLEVI